MGAKIITTDQTSQYLIGAGDFVVLMPGVTLTVEATTDPGFLADTTGNFTLTVLGEVVTYGKAAVLGHATTDVPLAALDVGEDGLLQSLTDVAVEVRRNYNVIDNAGTITGGGGGISYAAGVVGGQLTNSGTISSFLGSGIAALGGAGGGTPGLFEIVNTGAIEAGTDAVTIGNESLDLSNHGSIIAGGTAVAVSDDPSLANTLTLLNTGLIQGDTAAIDATGHADSVTNSGTLAGAVLLGDGDNLFDNSGTVTASVSAGTGADTFANTGSIAGTTDLGDGANAATNAGRLAGLATGSGADRFTNAFDGVVTGVVDLGDGANTVTNHGELAAGLSLGAGDDSLLNTGTITGDVILGAGTNTVTIGGALYGALVGGASADIVDIQGIVSGDVSFDAGADSLVHQGRIDGNVDMGSGTDTVWLGAGVTATPGSIDGGSGTDTLISRIDVEDVFNFEIVNLKGGDDLGAVADAIDNIVYGNRGANEIDGGDGADQLFGRSGGDTLLGGLGEDTIRGGRGADDLIGGTGADVLDGGRGRDSFAYEAITDSTKIAADRILDFERGRDQIDLSALVAGEVAWLGKDGFSGDGTAEVRIKAIAGNVDVKIDADGDGKLDMVIVVADLSKLDADDFIL